MWKNLRADCAGGTLTTTEKLERVPSKLKIGERITGPAHSGCPEGIASGLPGKTGEIAVRDVLGHGLPGGVDVLLDGNGTKSCGCYELVHVQADRWFVCDAKNPGSSRSPPLRHESVQTAFVPKTHADAGLFLLLKAAELSREWQKEIVMVQLDVKKAFDHVDHRAAFKAMRVQT